MPCATRLVRHLSLRSLRRYSSRGPRHPLPHYYTKAAKSRFLESNQNVLKQEAIWLGRVLGEMADDRLYPMLNIGSSTEEFRRSVQPWIDDYVFTPPRTRGLPVVHSDIKAAPGVDLVGNLRDPVFLAQLKTMRFKSVLCSNLLEHVENREEICLALQSVVDPGGYIIVTCPHRYPYHPDPIDTGYRPTPKELSSLFTACRPTKATIVDCGTHFSRLIANRRSLLKTIARLCLPFYKPVDWWSLLRTQTWMFRTFRVSCVVLERIA